VVFGYFRAAERRGWTPSRRCGMSEGGVHRWIFMDVARMVDVEPPFERNVFAGNGWTAPAPAMLGPLLDDLSIFCITSAGG
jgi:hypothetical protein